MPAAKTIVPLARPATFLTLLCLLVALAPWPIAQASPHQEPPVTLEATPRTLTPGQATSGTLLFKALEDGKYIQAPLQASDVKIEITGLTARTTLTQSFTNPTDSWVEGVYVFPLPEDAAADVLKMQIGERFIEGQIKERAEARRIYEEARSAGKKASLLEQERPNIFTNSVANIGPGERVVIQIEYQQGLKLEAGEVRLRFPMVVAPRFNPPVRVQMVSLEPGGFAVTGDAVPDRQRITPPVLNPARQDTKTLHNRVSMEITLRAGFALKAIESSFHAIKSKTLDEDTTVITLAEDTPANQDFELIWTADPGHAPTAALFRETFKGQDYLYALLTPPLADPAATPLPREVIFVIDNSGSMGGSSIRQARASLALALGRLRPADTFNVVRFDDTMETVFPSPVDANLENVATATSFVKALEARGGTVMLPALKAALHDPAPNKTSHLRQVIFLTDGAIGNEAEMFAEIGANLGRSRLFTIAIGSAPNSHFMTRAATLGRGTYTHIGNLAQVSDRMSELFAKLETPVLTDLKATFPDSSSGDIEAWPSPLPDLYTGEPILISVKVPDAKGKMIIEGMLQGKRWATGLAMEDAKPGTGIAKIWARRKISQIEQSRFEGKRQEDIDKGVLQTALAYNLVSRLTSLVAVDVTPSRPQEAPLISRDIPLNLPEGWDFEKVFGTAPPAAHQDTSMMRAQGLAPDTAYAAMVKPSAAPSKVTAQSQNGVHLPQGATTKDLQRFLGLLFLVIAALLLDIRHSRKTQ